MTEHSPVTLSLPTIRTATPFALSIARGTGSSKHKSYCTRSSHREDDTMHQQRATEAPDHSPPPALQIPDVCDAVDTALAARRLRTVWVDGTIVRISRHRSAVYGELAAFDEDGCEACRLGFAIPSRILDRVEQSLTPWGLAEGVGLRMGGTLQVDRRFGKLLLVVEAAAP